MTPSFYVSLSLEEVLWAFNSQILAAIKSDFLHFIFVFFFSFFFFLVFFTQNNIQNTERNILPNNVRYFTDQNGEDEDIYVNI